MRDKNNAIQLIQPTTKDKDGDGGDSTECQILIDIVDNGFLLNIVNGENTKTFVYHYQGIGDMGPKGMFQQIIDNLGLNGKIKIQ